MVRVDNREVRPTSRAPVPVVPGTDDQLRLMRNVAAGMCALGELAVDGPATVGALLAAADEALYEAKAGGRGRAAWREADGRIRVDEVSGPLPVDAATTDAPRRTTG